MITVVYRTANAPPMPVFEVQGLVDRPAGTAQLTRRKPPADVMNDRPGLRGLMVKDAHEQGKPQVSDFPSPEPLHSLEVQVFEEEVVVPEGQFPCELEVVVPTLVGDALVDAGECRSGLPPVVAPLLFGGELFGGTANSLAGLAVEQGGDLPASVAESEEVFQPEVRARDLTRHDAGVRPIFDLAAKEDVEVSQGVPLEGNGLHRPLDFTGFAETKSLPFDPEPVFALQRPSGLFEREGAVLTARPEAGRCGFDSRLPVPEKERISPVYPVGDVLDGLTAELVPVPEPRPVLEFSEVPLETVLVQGFVIQPVVPPVKGNTVIPNTCRYLDLPVQTAVLFGPVELERKRLVHAKIMPQNFAPYIPAVNDGALRRVG